MRDSELMAERNIRTATNILDLYVKIANSMFEEIKATNIGEYQEVKIETLATADEVPEQKFYVDSIDSSDELALGCVHFFGVQFLAYILSKTGIAISSIIKDEGLASLRGRFPVKEYCIIWRRLPEMAWRFEFETGNVLYYCSCRVLIFPCRED